VLFVLFVAKPLRLQLMRLGCPRSDECGRLPVARRTTDQFNFQRSIFSASLSADHWPPITDHSSRPVGDFRSKTQDRE